MQAPDRWKKWSTVALILAAAGCVSTQPVNDSGWARNDPNRPHPSVITPGKGMAPPSDAIVLFDGTDFSEWVSTNGDVRWKIKNGVMVATNTGNLRTRRSFGDCQLHIEWATPDVVEGSGQKRGNSGVFLMDKYEVQMLDSYDNVTYPDGQAAAVYGQHPPKLRHCFSPPPLQQARQAEKTRHHHLAAQRRGGAEPAGHPGADLCTRAQVQGPRRRPAHQPAGPPQSDAVSQYLGQGVGVACPERGDSTTKDTMKRAQGPDHR